MWTRGQVVLDRYRLLEPLGAGLGGETWMAQGPAGVVAVKLIQGENARAFRDLIREASLLRDLHHPNVVGYREFSDRSDEDCAILVTDLVDGGDLEAWVQLEGPRPVAHVVELGLQVLEALSVLDGAGILHRDLKPSNILVQGLDDGRVRLRVADFGISRRTRDGVARTRDRALTPAYAAPEQHTGGELSRATDLFALGGVLGFIATGRHPVDGPFQTGHEPLDQLIGALRHPDPHQRPDLVATRTALQAIVTGEAVQVQPVGATMSDWEADTAPAPGVSTRVPVSEPAPDAGASTRVPAISKQPTAPPGGQSARPRWGWWLAVGGLLLGLVGVGGVVVGLGWAIQSGLSRSAAHREAASSVQPAPGPSAEVAPSPDAVLSSDAPPSSPGTPEPEPPSATPAPGPATVAAASPEAAPADEASTPTVATSAAATSTAAISATLFVNSRPWSWVVVDGQRLGRTTDAGVRFTLPAGTHRLRLESDEGLSWERELSVKGERRVCVNLRTGMELGC